MVFEHIQLENKLLINDPQFGNTSGFRIMAATLAIALSIQWIHLYHPPVSST
ncbi:hypothetical protein DSBG_2618 [Desulfosporosinus sp. BG]|nr:hypothetical protein DSBG_2618 [Desulfosporosinus sp. BG]